MVIARLSIMQRVALMQEIVLLAREHLDVVFALQQVLV